MLVALKAFEKWPNTKRNGYWRTNEGSVIEQEFTKVLSGLGVRFVGSGKCSWVYKCDFENYVIKFNKYDGEQIAISDPHFLQEEYPQYYLDYCVVSEDGHCAIQPFVQEDRSLEAWNELPKELRMCTSKSNVGYIYAPEGKRAVIYDCW